MKKILHLFLIVGALLCSGRIKAQCDLQFANLVITPVGSPQVVSLTKCQNIFNFEFDIATNSGFKYLFFHSWLAADYPTTPIFDCSSSNATDPGTSTQLGTAVGDIGKSFLDIGFLNLNTITFTTGISVDVTSNLATVYPHDVSVILTQPSNSSGLTATVTRISSNVLHFIVNNIKVITNLSCGSLLSVKTDIWGSNQNAPDPKAQCYVCALSQTFNFSTVSLLKTCFTSPYQYSIGITTSSTTPLQLLYKLYADDLDFVKEPGTDDPLILTSVLITVDASTPYSAGPLDLPMPYCCIDPWSQWGIFAEVTGPDFSNSIGTNIAEPSCEALPVKLIGFKAIRNRSNVMLTWETGSEENNKGFEVQRLIGTSGWQNVGFVNTKAREGNSSSSMGYEFTDVNGTKGISQYRLREVNMDGKGVYSTIRSVRGLDQINRIIVYPNPSNNGRVNVAFDDADIIRDVSLMDMNGRIIRKWKAVTNNNIQIENLNPGLYTLRIMNTATGEQDVQKVVVVKNR